MEPEPLTVLSASNEGSLVLEVAGPWRAPTPNSGPGRGLSWALGGLPDVRMWPQLVWAEQP